MQPGKLFERYQELQRYVGWSEADARLVGDLAAVAHPHFGALIEDFYDAIQSNSATATVMTGGADQIPRLKGTLARWLGELFSGEYDQAYVLRRWKIGLRHVEIGLDQVYTSAALSRLRHGLLLALDADILMSAAEYIAAQSALNKLLDLELAIIQDAYQTEFVAWQNRKEREKLLHAERLAAIGETMAGLVHESRNILQRCRACLEMLEVDISDRPAALALVSRIRLAQDDLHRLFEEVREYAAPLKLNCSPSEIPAIWRQAWNELTNLHEEKQLRLVEVVEPASIYAEVDRFSLRQVFRNIFENAIQASPFHGQVTLRCKQVAIGGKSELDIVIGDHGAGIPPADRGRVFEPFFTTKAKGTGLGLAIARRIVESHGGHIAVAEPPAGTEILIQLPQA